MQAMALVAATAAGLAITRGLPEYLGTSEEFYINKSIITSPTGGLSSTGWGLSTRGTAFTPGGRPLRSRASYWLGHVPYWAGPCLVCWSIASTGLALRGSGPRPDALADRPDAATGPAVAVAVASQAIRCAFYHVANGRTLAQLWQHPESLTAYFWISLPRLAGFSVAIWWLALALGLRRAEGPRPWCGLGGALGWCWIAMAVSSEVGAWCYVTNY